VPLFSASRDKKIKMAEINKRIKKKISFLKIKKTRLKQNSANSSSQSSVVFLNEGLVTASYFYH